jgi:hypothetical protein
MAQAEGDGSAAEGPAIELFERASAFARTGLKVRLCSRAWPMCRVLTLLITLHTTPRLSLATYLGELKCVPLIDVQISCGQAVAASVRPIVPACCPAIHSCAKLASGSGESPLKASLT